MQQYVTDTQLDRHRNGILELQLLNHQDIFQNLQEVEQALMFYKAQARLDCGLGRVEPEADNLASLLAAERLWEKQTDRKGE